MKIYDEPDDSEKVRKALDSIKLSEKDRAMLQSHTLPFDDYVTCVFCGTKYRGILSGCPNFVCVSRPG